MANLQTHGSHLGTMKSEEGELSGESSVSCLPFVMGTGLDNNRE